MTDQDIIDAGGLVGLLLVFVFGYFAAFLPIVLALLETPRPDVSDDREELAARVAAYRLIVAEFFGLTVLVVLTLAPLSRCAVTSWSFAGPFPTIKAGLLVMELMLVSLAVATGVLWFRLTRRLRGLRPPKHR